MKSIAFPNMLSSTTTLICSDHDATASNLKLLLLSDRGGLTGDPYFGTNLKRLLFEQNNAVLRDIIIDEIYTATLQFMPQVLVNRKDIRVTSDRYKVYVDIKAKNLIDYTTNLYSISITDNGVNNQ